MFNPLNLFYTVRSYVSSYAHFVRGPVLLSLIWLAALCVVVWLYGPSIGYAETRPLESATNRFAVMGVMALYWAIYAIARWIRKRRADKAMVTDVTTMREGEVRAPDAADEARALQERLREALKTMRKISGGGRSYVYDVPWYMIIGAPGTGKSTALVNSGLKFPVMNDNAEDIFVRGVGGTRHCDWWFAEEAILIDTAGRYTTQEGDGGADREGWMSFLGMLKKHRPLQPVNGAIVALSVETLLSKDSRERLREARTIRRRLAELHEAFNLHIPVYLVITKMDMIPGFAEFFEAYDRYDREQVWGTTFPLDIAKDANSVTDAFVGEFDLLLERLNGLLLERMQQEPDRDQRGAIFGFPNEVAHLKEALGEVIGEICLTSKGMKAPRFRGVYLASATQEGADMEAVRNRIAGADPLAPGKRQETREAKSYFISRLMREVIFNEAALVNMDPKVFARRKYVRNAAIALAATVLIGVFGAWAFAYLTNVQALAETERRLDNYDQLAKTVGTQNISDSDFRAVLPALDALASAPQSFEERQPYEVASLGLSQAPKIETQAATLYAKALNRFFLPRIAVYLQDRIDERANDPSELFPTLKLYSMLGSLGPMDEEFARSWMAVEFATSFPGEAQAAFRDDLNRHFAALVARPIEPLVLNDVVIEKGRSTLEKQPVVERVLHSVTQDLDARSLSVWRASDHVSAAGQPLITRRSGAPISEGIPGIYTRDGYRKVLLPMLDKLQERYKQDAWVYGSDAPVPADLKEQALQLYAQEFQAAWRSYIADIQVRDFRDLSDAANGLSVLAAADNPLQTLAVAISDATDLRPQSAQVASAAAPGKSDMPDGVNRLVAEVEQQSLGHTGTGLTDPYVDLRSFVSKDKQGGTTPYGEVNNLMGQLYGQVSRAATASAETKELFSIDGSLNDSIQNLLQGARRMPAPVSGWMANLGAGISLLSADGARKNVSALWRSNGLPVCSNAVSSRYPFDRKATTDVAINDFVQLFGPSGLFDKFFQDNLAAIVDTTTEPWSWRRAAGSQAMPSDSLVQFERAAQIRQAFFGLGSSEPAISLDITPADLDGSSTSVVLDVAGTDISYAHGPRRSYPATWPGSEGERRARIAFQPQRPGTALTLTGPWALFRLIDAGKIQSVDDKSFGVLLTAGGRKASFLIDTGTVRNPFTLDAMAKFQCPELL